MGSGHFLVSALNELILLKFQLGILCDEHYERLKDIALSIENDEILVRDSHNAPFAYTFPAHENIESHKIQKALFYNKRKLIESCLFGVDINPNSCEITKLRLWIELLKYSFYKDIANKRLETLPNIDINIKCGNSLISHFDTYEYDKDKAPQRGTFAWLKKKDSTFSNNFRDKLLRYNNLVQMYKEKLGDKSQIDAEINALKAYFKDTLLNNGYIMESLEKHLGAFVRTYGDSVFDIETPFGMEMIKIIRKKNAEKKSFKFQPTLEELEPKPIDKKGQDLLALIHKEFETLESLRKSDTFEWRFAFPEVLDLETFEEKQKRVSANNAIKATQSQRNMKKKPQEIKDTFGDFKGFDLVIGNPPYIRQQEITSLKPHLKNYKCFDGAADIYVYFFELAFKLLKQNARFTFVTSNKWVKAGYGKSLQKFLLEKSFIESYIDFSGVKVFDSASVDVSIIEVSNYQYKQEIKCCEISQEQMSSFKNDVETIISNNYFLKPQSSLNLDYFRFEMQDNATHLIFKLKSFPLRFSNIAQIAKGSSTGNDKAFLFDFIANDKNTIEVKNEFRRFHIEKEILVPFCYGEDIKRFEYCKATKYLLYPYDKENILIHKHTLQNDYPLAYEYLENLKSVLLQRKIVIDEQNYYKFSALRNAHTYRTAKIMIPDLLNYPRFGFDNVGMFHNASIHNVALKENYQQMEKLILGVLNSKLFWFFIEKSSTKLGGSAIRLMPIYIDCFSFPHITQANQKIVDNIIALVDRILESKAKDSTFDTSTLESRIDSLVYQLYSLTNEEIQIIESK
ncbi:Eco57I restriction-modification methylase domain-containing protein [Helicobacter sp. MIT 21-1697]|uniref:Eco57I restriction-modification methylase domain-containing protein n=1 Tax=Helicobacter sp. MIT 21-1697 TaxID=2993733 RepID=UPI00224B2928|nr:Eco57I restriction-modification methylase domain-containing protein [Helicobacter sp. MIT 21-1697]MCX2717002.1 Eco57I restriction-modification methylase domain-containing protein [Helicobacter sp. MIT 21-1697]